MLIVFKFGNLFNFHVKNNYFCCRECPPTWSHSYRFLRLHPSFRYLFHRLCRCPLFDFFVQSDIILSLHILRDCLAWRSMESKCSLLQNFFLILFISVTLLVILYLVMGLVALPFIINSTTGCLHINSFILYNSVRVSSHVFRFVPSFNFRNFIMGPDFCDDDKLCARFTSSSIILSVAFDWAILLISIICFVSYIYLI